MRLLTFNSSELQVSAQRPALSPHLFTHLRMVPQHRPSFLAWISKINEVTHRTDPSRKVFLQMLKCYKEKENKNLLMQQ